MNRFIPLALAACVGCSAPTAFGPGDIDATYQGYLSITTDTELVSREDTEVGVVRLDELTLAHVFVGDCSLPVESPVFFAGRRVECLGNRVLEVYAWERPSDDPRFPSSASVRVEMISNGASIHLNFEGTLVTDTR